MSYQYPNSAIIVFAREPVEGKVKTRLIPALGKQKATRLYQALLHQTVENCRSDLLAPTYLYLTPESDSAYFTGHKTFDGIAIKKQLGEDLGDRMYNAIFEMLNKYDKVLLIGTDCPFINSRVLESAINSLNKTRQLVFAPALDGGYVLIGAMEIDKCVFTNVEWGTEKVMEQTRRALNERGLRWQELQHYPDIDVPEDLKHLKPFKAFADFLS